MSNVKGPMSNIKMRACLGQGQKNNVLGPVNGFLRSIVEGENEDEDEHESS